ncbi:modular serine protease-like [Prorops nasuta]|uniref:modular serine protease-like n=1 Tax=Prorops nasuta TaxID=863751 RepID=UPI0034CFC946
MDIILKSIFIFLYFCNYLGNTQSNTLGRQQSNKITNNCGRGKFQCLNGECIASEFLCDGRPDCKDQSDETQIECTKSGIICSEYAFKCTYGACVDGDVVCNGIKDCIDNSDETLPRCENLVHGVVNSTECSSSQFRCNDGQCILSTDLCDGIPQCRDKSDETFTTCGSFSCPQLVFRCNYGACIDGDLKCDGIVNCQDGSDEDTTLCNESTQESVSTTKWPLITRPTPQVTTIWKPKPRRPCSKPIPPVNGSYKLHYSQCPTNEDCELENGTEFEPGTYLVYSCNPGFIVQGSTDVFCGPEGKWLNIPTCSEIRCRALSSASIDAQCTYNDEWTSCESSVKPKTVAKLTCRNSYRQDTTLLTRQRDTVKCNEKGQWEPDPIRCIPVCGVSTSNTTPLIVNGTRPSISEFPWHATLYRADTDGAEKEFVCGATIIQDNLLITAAHCVYDEANKKLDNPNKYFISTGNIFRDYDSPLHDPRVVKKNTVKNIYMICNYLGLEGNYAWDIAILETSRPFVFSSLLVPICLDTSSFSDQSVLEAGNFGKVAGFGRTALGASSFVLQSITVPYIPLSQCKSSSVLSDNEKLITIDKFCAGYSNGSSVCDGDSGGGLVFKTGGLWYLRGIVSVGIGVTNNGGSRTCDSYSYSLYTRISSHIGWIQDVILKLEAHKAFLSCNNNEG